VSYFHFVFGLPAALGPIALQNKKVVYDVLLKAAAEALITIAEDPEYLGARIGITAVLHTWGEDLQHHPHAHCIVPSGGISPDRKRWVTWKPIFDRSTRALSAAFRRLALNRLAAAFDSGKLQFFGDLVSQKEPKAFAAALASLHTADWRVYAKEAFGGPKQALAYLSQFTHRVAITNNRLIDLDDTHVSFQSYSEGNSQAGRVVRLAVDEFIRRFLLHVLPAGFQRIRHIGFLANGRRAKNLALCRSLLHGQAGSPDADHGHKGSSALNYSPSPCPCCGGHMMIIETFEGSSRPHHVRKLDGL
jgi:hypothetical protein